MQGRAALALATSILCAALASAAPLVTGRPVAGDSSREKFARPLSARSTPTAVDSAAAIELGRTLFFDPRLSGSNLVACATCHHPGLSFADGLPKAVGHEMRTLGRRTPTLLNVGYATSFFWDGRAATLEEQALGPITSPGEMNLPIEALEAKLRAIPGYAPLFARAWPGEPIDAAHVARALAAFQRGIVSGEAPFDRWVAGDEQALSPEAQRGFAVFTGKGNCASCHAGWRFTDDSFYDIGVPGDDRGRGAVLPQIEVAQFAFKTPTLRNVALRAPYMHDGSEATLADVIELYDRGGRTQRPSQSPEVRPLELSGAEKAELVAFLDALTSQDAPISVPVLPR